MADKRLDVNRTKNVGVFEIKKDSGFICFSNLLALKELENYHYFRRFAEFEKKKENTQQCFFSSNNGNNILILRNKRKNVFSKYDIWFLNVLDTYDSIGIKRIFFIACEMQTNKYNIIDNIIKSGNKDLFDKIKINENKLAIYELSQFKNSIGSKDINTLISKKKLSANVIGQPGTSLNDKFIEIKVPNGIYSVYKFNDLNDEDFPNIGCWIEIGLKH